MDLCEPKKVISANNWSPTDSRESTGPLRHRPEGSNSADEREKLAELENEAKRQKVGGWGMTGQLSNGIGL